MAMAEGGVLPAEVAGRLRPPLLHRLPLADLVQLVAVLAERGLEGDLLRPALQARVAVAGPGLLAVPSQHLLRLASASTKSAVLAECALAPLVGAVAGSLAGWPLESVAELLLVTATSARAEGAFGNGVRRFLARASEVMTPRLRELSPQQLLKVVLAAGTVATHCRPLLQAAGEAALPRLAEYTPEQVMLLTQGLFPLGGQHPVVAQLADFWAQNLTEGADDQGEPPSSKRRRGRPEDAAAALPADEVADLARLLVLVAPEHVAVFEAIGARLVKDAGALTDSGRAALAAAFPEGGGPAFPGKDALLCAIAGAAPPLRRSEARATRRSRSRSSRRRRRIRSASSVDLDAALPAASAGTGTQAACPTADAASPEAAAAGAAAPPSQTSSLGGAGEAK